jgi:hypothetical protein
MVQGQEHELMLRFMLAMPILALGEAVGVVEPIRPAMGNAIDLLL